MPYNLNKVFNNFLKDLYQSEYIINDLEGKEIEDVFFKSAFNYIVSLDIRIKLFMNWNNY